MSDTLELYFDDLENYNYDIELAIISRFALRQAPEVIEERLLDILREKGKEQPKKELNNSAKVLHLMQLLKKLEEVDLLHDDCVGRLDMINSRISEQANTLEFIK